MSTSYPIAGKVALVPGAARGIGFATARLLHERGANVAILDLNRAPTPRRPPTRSVSARWRWTPT